MKFEMECSFNAEISKYHVKSREDAIQIAEANIPELKVKGCKPLGESYRIYGVYTTEVEAENAVSAHKAAEKQWVNSNFARMSFPSRSAFSFTSPIPTKTYADRPDIIQLEQFDVRDWKLPMAVFLNRDGFRQAYIGLPEGTSLFEDRFTVEQLIQSSKEDISYISKNPAMDELAMEMSGTGLRQMLWVGYDTGHLHDPIDYAAVEKVFGIEAAANIPDRIPFADFTNLMRDAKDCMYELFRLGTCFLDRMKEEEKLISCLPSVHVQKNASIKADGNYGDAVITVPLEFFDADGGTAMEILAKRELLTDVSLSEFVSPKSAVSFLAEFRGNGDCWLTGIAKSSTFTNEELITLSKREETALKSHLEQELGKSFQEIFHQNDKACFLESLSGLEPGEIIAIEPEYVGVEIILPTELTARLVVRDGAQTSWKSFEDFCETNANAPGSAEALEAFLDERIFCCAEVYIDQDGVFDLIMQFTSVDDSFEEEVKVWLDAPEREALLEKLQSEMHLDFKKLMELTEKGDRKGVEKLLKDKTIERD